MSEALAVQKHLLAKLRGSPPLLAAVPASNIFDSGNERDVFPSIVLGEAQTVADDNSCADAAIVYTTLHIWSRQTGTAEAKIIAGAIRRVLRKGIEETRDGFQIRTLYKSDRFFHDSDGKTVHGVVNIESEVEGLEA